MKNENLIIDTHTHYDDEAYAADREEVLRKLPSFGIRYAVNIGADLDSSRRSIELAKAHEHIYAVVGVHPSNTKSLSVDYLNELKKLAAEEKVLAIGEIGLDYHWEDMDKTKQKKCFVEQLELAGELALPVVIHSRDAAADTFDILKSHAAGRITGVMHSYSYSLELAREYINMGMFIGIGGVSTFKNARKLKEVIEYIPLDSIVLETDCPYLAPEPYRGKRNSSEYLSYVIAAIAKLKSVDEAGVIEKTYENAHRLYSRLKDGRDYVCKD